MILDNKTKQALANYLDLLESNITFNVSIGDDDRSLELWAFIEEIASMSDKLKIAKKSLERTPSFEIMNALSGVRVTFAAIPLGHEFTSFVMAMLQVSGRPPKIGNTLMESIKNIQGTYKFETYVSLSCHNCPGVVQALNIMSVLNKNITHTMIDGSLHKEEVERLNIMSVPAVYLNGEFFESGRIQIEDIIKKLSPVSNENASKNLNSLEPYDVLVIGGGPAGASAAIYTARKGLRTAVIAERFGGQIMDTIGIENFISVKATEGPKLARALEEHVKDYEVSIINAQTVVRIARKEYIEVYLESGSILKSKSVIISTGARWRELGVPGEKEFKNKGVAYCPHCDGPFFKEKDVAVIGGGNSGVEAAIDLAGIVKNVTLIEYGDTLRADAVLQERARATSNIRIITSAKTESIIGGDKVTGLTYTDRNTGESHVIELSGVFVQIGLVPNTAWLKDTIELNKIGEIEVNARNETNMPGVFAAGDCSSVPYKQIIIAMGEGAKAGLSAFDYLIRN